MQDLKVKSGVLPKALEIRYALIKVSLVDNLRGQNLKVESRQMKILVPPMLH